MSGATATLVDEMCSVASSSGGGGSGGGAGPLPDKDSSSASMPDESRVMLGPSSISGYGGGGDECIKVYPFPLVLRLRVLQIVCGISAVVMGAVACIEERSATNLGLGVPTGLVTIVAAACSIYNSRGFGGYKPKTTTIRGDYYDDDSLLTRILAPTIPALLWSVSCALHVALLVLVFRTLFLSPDGSVDMFDDDLSPSTTLIWLSVIFGSLSSATLGAQIYVLRIDCARDIGD